MCEECSEIEAETPSEFTIRKLPDPKYGESYILILDSPALPGPIALTSSMTLLQILNMIEDTTTAYQRGVIHSLDNELSTLLERPPD